MRINVYEEEVTDEVQLIRKVSEQGTPFYGFRIFLKSHSALSDTAENDDRSAVTFWVAEPTDDSGAAKIYRQLESLRDFFKDFLGVRS